MTDSSVHPQYPLLLSPLTVGTVTLRNRYVMPPMATAMGVASERARAFYAARALGGAGMVIVEGTSVNHFRDPEFNDGIARLAEAIHAGGAVAVMQLYRGATFNGDEVGVSEGDGKRAVTTEELNAVPEEFAVAVHACRQAGFDGCEVHGAHGFFFNQFFSPHFNKRMDAYGGTLQNRMRLGIETVKAMRAASGAGFLVMYRHTPAEYFEDGYDLDETLSFVPELVFAGIDIIDISPSTGPEPAPLAGLAAAVKGVSAVPVIAVGGMNEPEVAEQTLQSRKADLIAIGRGLIADPELPNKVKDGREAEIVKCVKDDAKCFGNLGKNIPIGCTQNPRAGYEFHED